MRKNSITLLHGVFDKSIFDLLRKKKFKDIFILEGRPSLKAAKIACRELLKRNMKPTLISDNMAGFLFFQGAVREVFISCQSVEKNRILSHVGGLILSVLGKKHKVPVNAYSSGERSALLGRQKEILYFNGIKTAPSGTKGYVPLAEWVPKKYIGKIYGC